MTRTRADAAIFFLPPSPSDTNPPLGPAILAREARRLGVELAVRDLNIEYVNTFRSATGHEIYTAIGDQGKDRALVAKASSSLFQQFAIDPTEILHLPDVGHPEAGMHYTLAGLSAAIRQHIRQGSTLVNWLNNVLDDMDRSGWPPVVGVSIMGPSQVFASLLFLALVRQRRPATRTVAGGSHVTLLEQELVPGSERCEYVDHVFPGHSEEQFAQFVVEIGGRPTPPTRQTEHFAYLPHFENAQLSLYPKDRLALPVQFTRGCSYARCTYCTYPVVEPVATRLFAADAAAAMMALRSRHQITRFSLKDSLLTVPMLTQLATALLDNQSPRLQWSGTTKIVRALIPALPLLAASGLKTLEFGVESIHRRSLQLADKVSSLDVVEEVVQATADAGIVAVVNLMFGFPGEQENDATAQLDWAASLRQALGTGKVDFSLNMLEVVRGSAMARDQRYGVIGIAPWAYCYEWSAPGWRRQFARYLNELEERATPALREADLA